MFCQRPSDQLLQVGPRLSPEVRELWWMRKYLHYALFVSRAEHPLCEGNHEPLPERVTKLAGYGVHHSHGEHAPELPRPHLSL